MKLIFSLFLIFMHDTGLGQDIKNKRFGFTLNMNTVENNHSGAFQWGSAGYSTTTKNYCYGINFNYFLTEKMILRLKCTKTQRSKVGIIDYETFAIALDTLPRPNSTGYGKETSDQHDFSISTGLIYQHKLEKFSVFGGIDLNYIKHSEWKSTALSHSETQGSIVNSESTNIQPGGISFGFGMVMGFNYFPINWISVGCEFSPIVLYSIYGDFVYRKNMQNNNGFIQYSEVKLRQTTKTTHIDYVKSSINLSFWF